MNEVTAVVNAQVRARAIRNSLRPPLKWAGGKRWQVPHLLPLWEPHRSRRLVEPFCGGLAVTMGLHPERALLNDINPHLVNFYRWLKRGLKTDLDMKNSEKIYYRHRRRLNDLLTNGGAKGAETAALFYFLNRTGYNGLCRFNRKGEFNVPFGRYATISYTSDFSPYKRLFGGWEFRSQDFARLLSSDTQSYALRRHISLRTPTPRKPLASNGFGLSPPFMATLTPPLQPA